MHLERYTTTSTLSKISLASNIPTGCLTEVSRAAAISALKRPHVVQLLYYGSSVFVAWTRLHNKLKLLTPIYIDKSSNASHRHVVHSPGMLQAAIAESSLS